MSSFSHILSDIRSLTIQGAHAIALAGLGALEAAHREGIDLDSAREQLFCARPTEPYLRNAVNYVLYDTASLARRIKDAKRILLDGHRHVCEYGAHKIRGGMVVYTHCHSSTVVGVLAQAWGEGTRFRVHNTETRPLYQGRKTARDLAEVGVPVTHFIDSGVHYALKKADLVLIGCDALSCEGAVVNKVGSEIICGLANHLDIPVYACTHSWKFDPLSLLGYDEVLEERDASEVWEDAPLGVTISNPAFSLVPANLLTGVISDQGVYRPELLVEELKKKNPWMFKRLSSQVAPSLSQER
ncbi:MAG: translation initiation factor eIF-2B [Nanobdellota archaeon]